MNKICIISVISVKTCGKTDRRVLAMDKILKRLGVVENIRNVLGYNMGYSWFNL